MTIRGIAICAIAAALAPVSIACGGDDETASAAGSGGSTGTDRSSRRPPSGRQCPSEGRVGYCTLPPTLGIVAVYNYYEPVYTSADAQSECDGLDGEFTAG